MLYINRTLRASLIFTIFQLICQILIAAHFPLSWAYSLLLWHELRGWSCLLGQAFCCNIDIFLDIWVRWLSAGCTIIFSGEASVVILTKLYNPRSKKFSLRKIVVGRSSPPLRQLVLEVNLCSSYRQWEILAWLMLEIELS